MGPSEKAVIGAGQLKITASKFYDWPERYGKVNEHNEVSKKVMPGRVSVVALTGFEPVSKP